VLATLWARRRVEDIVAEDYAGVQRGQPREDVRQSVTQLGLEYRLMTPFTSFVAVEEVMITDGGQPRRVEVPIETPEGSFGSGVSTLPVNGRTYGLQTMSAMSVSETVTVTSSGSNPASRAPGSLVIDQSMIDPGTLLMREDVRAKRKKPKDKPKPPDPAEALRQALRAKLHPSVYAVVERLEKQGAAAAGESEFVRDGKAELQIWLTEKTPEVLAQLKQLGFEVVLDPQSAKLVIGRLPVEKLAALAGLGAVRYVAPQ
jgi:hypothetical protein